MELEAFWYEDDEWRGYLPVATASELRHLHVLSTIVAGLRFYPDGSQDASFAPGTPLVLVPEPDNPWDPFAIAVWNGVRTLQAGHIPRMIADKMTPAARTAVSQYEQVELGRRIALGMLVGHEPLTLIRASDSDERTERTAKTVSHLKAAAKAWSG